MNLKELWIGERILIISSGKTGTFEGIGKGGKARVLASGKMLLVSETNMKIIHQKDEFPDIHLLLNDEEVENQKPKPLKISIAHTLDLHIDKLAPHMENELPGRILDFQLQKSESFIQDAIRLNYPHITIIHGKGQGVLKQAIEHQLTNFNQVKFTFSKNGGGAVEVWL